MHILLSNDDGYQAPGIRCLGEALAALARVTVVAPDRNRSGASNSLTLDQPIRAEQREGGVISVDGTPTDCVHLAVTGLLAEQPDMVVAGINEGPNLGDDVLYSGTVAAAMEGRFLGLPAFAVSLAGTQPKHYTTAAVVTVDLIARMQRQPLPADTILNINVPDRPRQLLEGMQVTRLGHRHQAERVVRSEDPRGRPLYWVGPPGVEQDAGPGTDFFAVNAGFVSITPIQVDLTRYAMLDSLKQWLDIEETV